MYLDTNYKFAASQVTTSKHFPFYSYLCPLYVQFLFVPFTVIHGESTYVHTYLEGT